MSYNEDFLLRAIKIAEAGLGMTHPNPIVGAVIVSADGTVLGEGFHIGARVLVLGAGGATRGVIGPLLEQLPASSAAINDYVDPDGGGIEKIPGGRSAKTQ